MKVIADDYAGSNLRSWTTRDGTTYGQVCGKCGAQRVDRQIGLEASPDEWAAELVAVFRECRRILRRHGTLWVECGDSYGANQGNGFNPNAREGHRNRKTEVDLATPIRHPYKPKDLIGGPWLLAFALRADGWYLRQCIIWAKPNAMPESVRDRCTTAHSYVFLLSKQPRYWFDADAISEPHVEPWRSGTNEVSTSRAMATDEKVRKFAVDGRQYNPNGKNARSVWTIPTRGYPGAHFATWPETLAERIILAGCPEKVCGTCGKPRERLVESTRLRPAAPSGNREIRRWSESQSNGDLKRTVAETIGWSDCGHDNHKPGVVLDPFLGAGTTGLAALRHGRSCVGVELNPDYAEMARERCREWWKRPEPPVEVDPNQLSILDVEPQPRQAARAGGLTGGAYSPPGQTPHSNAR